MVLRVHTLADPSGVDRDERNFWLESVCARSRGLSQRIEHPSNRVGGLCWSVLVDVVPGAGQDSGGAVGWRSYTEAREALDLARRLGLAEPIVPVDSLLPYRVLTLDPTTVAEMVRAVLGPLDDARGGPEPLIATLDAYFAESGNASGTARRLHLSPRAVVYRLERIAQLTGTPAATCTPASPRSPPPWHP